jgi:hypothetical protein
VLAVLNVQIMTKLNDHNAAAVIPRLGVWQVLNGASVQKKK